jgi:hypothetical protein
MKRIVVTLYLLVFALACLCYYILLLYYGTEQYQYTAIIVEALSLLLLILLSVYVSTKTTHNKAEDMLPSLYLQEYFGLATPIVIATGIVNSINIYFLSQFIDFSGLETTLDVKKFFLINGILSVLVGTIGSWLFQSVLTFLLAISLGSKSRFKIFLHFIGLAYTGFFIFSLIGLIFNFSSMESIIPIKDVDYIMLSSKERIAIAKFGEFFTLTSLSYLFLQHEKIHPIKSAIIAFIPNVIVSVVSLSIQTFISSPK